MENRNVTEETKQDLLNYTKWEGKGLVPIYTLSDIMPTKVIDLSVPVERNVFIEKNLYLFGYMEDYSPEASNQYERAKTEARLRPRDNLQNYWIKQIFSFEFFYYQLDQENLDYIGGLSPESDALWE